MDHSFIEENNQIDRYVRGTMPADERTVFEEHFLDCPECLEQLEIARSLRESLRIAGADLAATADVRRAVPSGALGKFFGWRWAAALAGACVAVAVLIGVFLYRQLERTRNELNRTQLAYVREKQRGESAVESATRNAPVVYTLNQSRGGASPAAVVGIPPSPRWLVFSIPIDASQFSSYRANLRNASGSQVWQKDNLQTSSPDAIAISVLSNVLTPGAYTLSLEGLGPSGNFIPIAVLPLQAEQQK